ncbi:hypothetical protein K227x_10170 [Rubripirellula lacrimiformis]|uniref:Uncharacterized protein n=1 Tax=Rubripirellula lacrimiformis TaxID=1930273 RepID=A0A517N668_9BACT|nr:hypothetical protein [Rubripirellula lacrimiformis]QDT02639.1 hypothetical protein K227x_10170 [Rubripirellula lacrimiformis]
MSLQNLSSRDAESSFPFVVGAPSHESNAESTDGFVDRRSSSSNVSARSERRQFGSAHLGLSEQGRELALAIDQYKVEHHRRYLTCDEMLQVMTSLGYAKLGSDG